MYESLLKRVRFTTCTSNVKQCRSHVHQICEGLPAVRLSCSTNVAHRRQGPDCDATEHLTHHYLDKLKVLDTERMLAYPIGRTNLLGAMVSKRKRKSASSSSQVLSLNPGTSQELDAANEQENWSDLRSRLRPCCLDYCVAGVTGGWPRLWSCAAHDVDIVMTAISAPPRNHASERRHTDTQVASPLQAHARGTSMHPLVGQSWSRAVSFPLSHRRPADSRRICLGSDTQEYVQARQLREVHTT